MYNHEKSVKPCMNMTLLEASANMSAIAPIFAFIKLPKIACRIIAHLFSRVLDDPLVARLVSSLGGNSFWAYATKTDETINCLLEEKREYQRMFNHAWNDMNGMDCVICPGNDTIKESSCVSADPNMLLGISMAWNFIFFSIFYFGLPIWRISKTNWCPTQ
jgi:hypothetical protein